MNFHGSKTVKLEKRDMYKMCLFSLIKFGNSLK